MGVMEPRTPAKLPLIAVVGLALLAVPRVVLHDLGLIQESTFVNALFVFVPPVLWIVVVLLRRDESPMRTLLLVGLCYGVFLAIGHQLLWNHALGGNPLRLGGNLAALDPVIAAAVVRGFAVVSSVITGLLVGAISGVVAWAVTRLLAHRAARVPVDD